MKQGYQLGNFAIVQVRDHMPGSKVVTARPEREEMDLRKMCVEDRVGWNV